MDKEKTEISKNKDTNLFNSTVYEREDDFKVS